MDSHNRFEYHSRTSKVHILTGVSVRRFVAFLLLVIAVPARAQELMIPASELTAYVRMLELQGKATNTPLVYWASSTAPRVKGLTVDSAHVWRDRFALRPRSERPERLEVNLLDAQADLVYNSGFPRISNDGAAWAGKGASGVVRGGAEARWGRLTARLYPSLVYAQNSAFPLAVGRGNSRSPYAYPWQGGIDFPQRFGAAAVSFLDWGQSELRADFDYFTVGLSTENLWWGPGYRNAIIMGSAAPGFPHVDLGTGRPVRTPIGDMEVRLIWGELARSNYFGADPGDGRRILNGLTLGYRPRFLPGLTLGVNRVLFHEYPRGGLGASDFLGAISQVFNNGHPDSTGSIVNDIDDQLASVTARWMLPESGFEAYVEYAREDFARSPRALFVIPEHSRGYTAGFQKALTSSGGTFVLRGENTVLGQTGTQYLAGGGSGGGGFYTHGTVLEGYTNRGQLLGATIGPGSNAQYLGLDRYTANGRLGIYVERIGYDDDYVYNVLRYSVRGDELPMVDLTVGVNVLRFVGAFDWNAGMELTRTHNRYFQLFNDVTNLKLSFSVGWHRTPAADPGRM